MWTKYLTEKDLPLLSILYFTGFSEWSSIFEFSAAMLGDYLQTYLRTKWFLVTAALIKNVKTCCKSNQFSI